jgi:DNA-binding transcriptional ArsR family regulator
MTTGTRSPEAAACCAPLGTAGLSDDQAQATARLFKALADPHRVRILNLADRQGHPARAGPGPLRRRRGEGRQRPR